MQAELADTQTRYIDLYDQAPVGYLTLSTEGLILEANSTAATLLSVARAALVREPISRFIGKEYQESFRQHCQQLFETGIAQKCELRMVKSDGRRFWAHNAARVVSNSEGVPVCRIVMTDITRRKQTEEHLRVKSLVFDESLMANSVADLEGLITEVNASFLRIWCYTNEDEVVGKSIPYFLNDLNEAAAILAGLNETGYWEGDFSARRKDGSAFIAHGLATVVRDENDQVIGYQSAVVDITGTKRAEQTLRDWNQTLEVRVAERTMQLQQSDARFRQLAAATFEGIAIIEGDILIDGNAQLGQLHGYELEEMIGRPGVDFVAPESHALVTQCMRDGIETTYECKGLRKDGSIFPLEVRASKGIWQGKTMRISALRDLSTSKQTAARLQAQQTELEQAQRLALVSEVSAGIIHQLGQPLCAIAANVATAKLLLNECESKQCGSLEIIRDVEADVERIRDAVIHLRALVNPGQPPREPIDFNEMVASVLRLLRQESENRQFHVVFEPGPALPPVLADTVQLSQVILNLVRNAFDAGADGPPERRRVVITTQANAAGCVELCVSDAGPGILPEAMNRLFTSFFTTKPEGLGIGLSLSRTIVEAHGGRILGSNNPDGMGATFRVVLPVSPACASQTNSLPA